MTTPPPFDVTGPAAAVYAVLWIGALRLAIDPTFDPVPDELDELMARYFAAWRPVAKG
jgi:hypothetical protein